MPEFLDPDVDLHDARQRAEILGHEWDFLLAIAVGGVLGAEARYAIGNAMSHHAGTWPWSTLLINLVGSAVLAVVMAVLAELSEPPRLARPFVGVGLCGGFTTFSTFGVEAYQLFDAHRPLLALWYALASLLACALGVVVASLATHTAMRRRVLR